MNEDFLYRPMKGSLDLNQRSTVTFWHLQLLDLRNLIYALSQISHLDVQIFALVNSAVCPLDKQGKH
jgi:hypothetical protein